MPCFPHAALPPPSSLRLVSLLVALKEANPVPPVIKLGFFRRLASRGHLALLDLRAVLIDLLSDGEETRQVAISFFTGSM